MNWSLLCNLGFSSEVSSTGPAARWVFMHTFRSRVSVYGFIAVCLAVGPFSRGYQARMNRGEGKGHVRLLTRYFMRTVQQNQRNWEWRVADWWSFCKKLELTQKHKERSKKGLARIKTCLFSCLFALLKLFFIISSRERRTHSHLRRRQGWRGQKFAKSGASTQGRDQQRQWQQLISGILWCGQVNISLEWRSFCVIYLVAVYKARNLTDGSKGIGRALQIGN